MPKRKPAKEQREVGLKGLPTKERGEKSWAARGAEQAAAERRQVQVVLRSYREFADIWQTGVKNASSFREFAVFIGPAARELAEQARVLEIMLAANDQEKGQQGSHAA